MKARFAILSCFSLPLLIFSVLDLFGQPPMGIGASIPRVDTNIYVILPYDSSAMMAMDWRYKNARPDSLTRSGVDSLEAMIDSDYLAYTKDSTAYMHDLSPLSKYSRQYVALVTDKGEREVWVNLICGRPNYWRRRPVIVDDGGKCFVQLFINLTRRRVYDLIPGGEAYRRVPTGSIVSGPQKKRLFCII
jgi:hypothetical protein